jgi:hypothetical protein
MYQGSLFVVLALFLSVATNAQKQFSLDELIDDPRFTVMLEAAGTYGGSSVVVRIQSDYKKPVELRIPAGTVFYTGEEDHQPLLLVEEELIAIAKKGKRRKILDGYCIAASNAVPEEASNLQFGPVPNEQLQQLADYLNNQRGLEEHAIQEAVWCVSDGHPLSYIYTEIPENGRELSAFVAELTGQEVPWHQVRRQLSQSDGYITATPVVVSGEARFSPEEPTTISSRVTDASGNVVFEGSEPVTIPAAREANIRFNLSVAGWDAGTYRVQFYDQEGTVLLEKEFEI